MRISTTTLESFRLFLKEEWMEERELLATIKGEFVPTHNVQLGKAFGQVLEDPIRYCKRGGYTCDGFNFGNDVMIPALEAIGPRGVFEAKAVTRYGPHTVVAKADHLYGAHLTEFKTTLSTFDFDKYFASCQWRFMQEIFQPALLTYTVFCLFESQQNGVIELRGIETFHLYPYGALHQECTELVGRFVEYVTRRKLTHYLERQGSGLEAA